MPEISPERAEVIGYALQAAALYAVVPTILLMLWVGYAIVQRR